VPVKEESVGLADILVHLDHFAGSASRLDVAVHLAKRHQARLTGLVVIRHQYPAKAAVLAARGRFEQLMAEAGVDARWLSIDGSSIGAGMTDILLDHAHASDLLIIGQGSSVSASVGVPFDLPERVVLESGLPVLVVPYAGAFASVGERVLVPWKAGRESTRAVNDAMPILKLAQQVELLSKSHPGMPGADGDGLAARVCAHLARHGVTAKATNLMTGDAPLGEVLLNRAYDEGFDLLVVGASAYGQEGKMALGSVARQLLKEMTIPVLMSH
jgi:nucleotide-binding universal stress UspA family protein